MKFKDEVLEEVKLQFEITQFILFHFSMSSNLIRFIQSVVLNYSKSILQKCTLNRNNASLIYLKNALVNPLEWVLSMN